ncbi:hypothetical protein GH714_020165 [Hevea brasiliensis]|uniref:Rx N-terminal domain-containing protein n=1 Tax=Hevea brasiliensis TaxID=3981 RepID=A0A6A6LI31_HEVBR|nr:hypothetical protein GH714_020165 [Hevea brasiliensis]
MAETLVSIALQQLAKIMEEQVKLVTGVEEDVRTLKSNLQSIQGVLVEAEKNNLKCSHQAWLDNLKDVSYAIDDVLDEWSTAIVRAQTEEDDFSHSWFESQLLQFPFLRQVCSFLPINSCFACTEFGNRYEIARKIKKLNARLDDIAKERKRYTFKLTEGNEEVNKPLVVTSAIDVAEVKGREQDKTAIKKMLMVESGNRSNLQLQVVSIAGIGGLGKTTLAKLVYNDKDVEKYFENRVWVSVSKPFDEKNNEERGRLEAIGREIVEKCDGLPMAAKTLACLLRSKQSWKEWQSVLDSEVWELDGLWEKGSETQSGFASLWLSYYNMVSELRPCFSYCSIFPKDHEIKKDVLIQLWMAQGYLRQTPAEDMERIGEKYFQNLAAFSFFEELKKDDYGNIISCKMYNIVHDFAKYIRKNECLSIKVNGGEELRTDSLGKEVRHLRVMLGKEVSFPSSIYRLKNLRSLWVQSKGNSMIGAALPNLFSRLTCLRTLNLSNCNIVEIPSTISKLIHLRQIDLSYNKELKELPETLCELYNLQTLNISWCVSLVKLPRGIEKLINLRHLNNGGFEGVLPKGIRRLSCLRSLDRFGIGHDGEESCTLGDMKGLNNLQGYFCIRGLENVADVDEGKQAELKKKTEVSPLELRFGKGDAEWRKSHDGELLDALEPPPYVQELRLPSLEFLRIWGMDGIKKVGPEFLGTETQSASVVAFPRLIKLRFVRMRNLEGWADEFSIKRTIMPRLRTLSFAWCPKLKAVPDQMLGKATLQELIFTCSLC